MKVKRNLTKNGEPRIELIFDDTEEMRDFHNVAYDAYDAYVGAYDTEVEALLALLYISSYRVANFVPFDRKTMDFLNIKDEFPEWASK